MASAWLRAFLLTAAVELPIVLYLTRGEAGSPSKRLTVALFAQLSTHPLVWFVFPYIPRLTGLESLALSEAWAFLGEAWLYAVALGLAPARALAASGLANGTSFAVGLLLPALFAR